MLAEVEKSAVYFFLVHEYRPAASHDGAMKNGRQHTFAVHKGNSSFVKIKIICHGRILAFFGQGMVVVADGQRHSIIYCQRMSICQPRCQRKK